MSLLNPSSSSKRIFAVMNHNEELPTHRDYPRQQSNSPQAHMASTHKRPRGEHDGAIAAPDNLAALSHLPQVRSRVKSRSSQPRRGERRENMHSSSDRPALSAANLQKLDAQQHLNLGFSQLQEVHMGQYKYPSTMYPYPPVAGRTVPGARPAAPARLGHFYGSALSLLRTAYPEYERAKARVEAERIQNAKREELMDTEQYGLSDLRPQFEGVRNIQAESNNHNMQQLQQQRQRSSAPESFPAAPDMLTWGAKNQIRGRENIATLLTKTFSQSLNANKNKLNTDGSKTHKEAGKLNSEHTIELTPSQPLSYIDLISDSEVSDESRPAIQHTQQTSTSRGAKLTPKQLTGYERDVPCCNALATERQARLEKITAQDGQVTPKMPENIMPRHAMDSTEEPENVGLNRPLFVSPEPELRLSSVSSTEAGNAAQQQLLLEQNALAGKANSGRHAMGQGPSIGTARTYQRSTAKPLQNMRTPASQIPDHGGKSQQPLTPVSALRHAHKAPLDGTRNEKQIREDERARSQSKPADPFQVIKGREIQRQADLEAQSHAARRMHEVQFENTQGEKQTHEAEQACLQLQYVDPTEIIKEKGKQRQADIQAQTRAAEALFAQKEIAGARAILTQDQAAEHKQKKQKTRLHAQLKDPYETQGKADDSIPVQIADQEEKQSAQGSNGVQQRDAEVKSLSIGSIGSSGAPEVQVLASTIQAESDALTPLPYLGTANLRPTRKNAGIVDGINDLLITDFEAAALPILPEPPHKPIEPEASTAKYPGLKGKKTATGTCRSCAELPKKHKCTHDQATRAESWRALAAEHSRNSNGAGGGTEAEELHDLTQVAGPQRAAAVGGRSDRPRSLAIAFAKLTEEFASERISAAKDRELIEELQKSLKVHQSQAAVTQMQVEAHQKKVEAHQKQMNDFLAILIRDQGAPTPSVLRLAQSILDSSALTVVLRTDFENQLDESAEEEAEYQRGYCARKQRHRAAKLKALRDALIMGGQEIDESAIDAKMQEIMAAWETQASERRARQLQKLAAAAPRHGPLVQPAVTSEAVIQILSKASKPWKKRAPMFAKPPTDVNDLDLTRRNPYHTDTDYESNSDSDFSIESEEDPDPVESVEEERVSVRHRRQKRSMSFASDASGPANICDEQVVNVYTVMRMEEKNGIESAVVEIGNYLDLGVANKLAQDQLMMDYTSRDGRTALARFEEWDEGRYKGIVCFNKIKNEKYRVWVGHHFKLERDLAGGKKIVLRIDAATPKHYVVSVRRIQGDKDCKGAAPLNEKAVTRITYDLNHANKICKEVIVAYMRPEQGPNGEQCNNEAEYREWLAKKSYWDAGICTQFEAAVKEMDDANKPLILEIEDFEGYTLTARVECIEQIDGPKN